MAMGFIYRCAYCGHEEDFVFGPDMSSVFPETKEKALAGKLGAPAKRAAEAWPNGCFDCQDALWVCDHCGRLRVQPVLDYLIKDDGRTPLNCWMGDDEDMEEEHVQRVFHYRHLCGHCRSLMHSADDGERGTGALRCPVCGKRALEEVKEGTENRIRSTIKTLEEFYLLSDDLKPAYVEKCIAYWEECGYDKRRWDDDLADLTEEQLEDYRRMMDIFRADRIG